MTNKYLTFVLYFKTPVKRFWKKLRWALCGYWDSNLFLFFVAEFVLAKITLPVNACTGAKVALKVFIFAAAPDPVLFCLAAELDPVFDPWVPGVPTHKPGILEHWHWEQGGPVL